MAGSPWRCLGLVLALALFSAAFGEEDLKSNRGAQKASDLADLSIEELMNIRITSVSKKEEAVSRSPSAIHVITQEDIRRSGVTSIADALRMAPGVNVAQINAHSWAISARGFQAGLANKMLVLIDGRSVYTPLYEGVYWDVQDTLLEDIERIEVIRGPGATVWGANAVNGVVNIITKDSKDTQGGLVSASLGTKDHTIDSVRYGGKIGEKTSYRIFAKYAKRDELTRHSTGFAAHDGWEVLRTGARFDIRASEADTVIAQGDYYTGLFEEKVALPQPGAAPARSKTQDAPISGGHVLARWEHEFSARSHAALQVYYDRTERKQIILDQIMDTFDLDYSHHLSFDRHEIVYGAGYRFVKEALENTFVVDFQPPDRQTHTFSAFAQDEITILEDELSVTIGSKFEHNSFTGFEVQPSLRALWRPAQDHTVWASVSRAVRTPSPVERDLRLNVPASPAVLLALIPNRDLRSESVIAFELGYRALLHPRFSIDTAGFYNLYDNLRSLEALPPFAESTPPPPHLTIPFGLKPWVTGETYGGEFSAHWRPIDRINIAAGYSFLQMLLHRNSRSADPNAEAAEGRSPQHQFHVRAFADLPHDLQLDAAVYFYDRLDNFEVPSHTRVDARLGWHPLEDLDVSLGVQNALREDHVEFGESPSRIERNLYLKCTFKF